MGLMNGLSALGAGVAQFAGTAGLESQKALLAQQQTILADQLATTRETTLQKSAGDIAAAAAEKQNTFLGGQGDLNRQSAQTIAQTGAGATLGAANIQAAAERYRADEPPDAIKMLRALGVQLPGDTPRAGGTPQAGGAGPAASGAAGAAGSATPDTSASGAGSGTPAAPTADPMENPLVRKALGFPAAGSQEASRMAIAQDVNSDPAFKYKTAGQKASEIESRVAVAEGKMTDPDSRAKMAASIASYQVPALENYALTKPGGPETMAKVMELNPDYQASRFPEIQKAMGAFGSGPQGNVVRSGNVVIQHLDVLDQAAQNLGNTNVGVVNTIKNAFKQQFGSPAPTTFDGLRQIVGTEVEKAVAGGIGASADRDRIMAALNKANSPAQLQAITDGFRSLLVGQLSGLKTQYEDDTGIKAGPFAFENKLAPETRAALAGHSGGTAAPAPTPAASIPPWAKPGDQYSPSRGQARAADGTVYGGPQ